MENRKMKNFMKWHKRGEAKAKVKNVRVPSWRPFGIVSDMFENIMWFMWALNRTRKVKYHGFTTRRQLKRYNILTKESNELMEELSNESN